MAHTIEIDNIHFSYVSDLPIYKGASLTIEEGTYLGVIGPNGGGKTTLLKLIMGFIKPEKGTVTVFGKSPKEARPLMGYVPQHAQLDKLFPISLMEMVLMGRLHRLTWYGKFRKEDKEAAIQALEEVGLADQKDAIFGTLSGGQVQRGLIARSLVSEPKLLLLDEPTANVDPEAEEHIYEILQGLKGKITILMVTHDLQTALDQVDRLCLVEKDLKIYTPTEVCDHYTVGLYHKKIETHGKETFMQHQNDDHDHGVESV